MWEHNDLLGGKKKKMSDKGRWERHRNGEKGGDKNLERGKTLDTREKGTQSQKGDRDPVRRERSSDRLRSDGIRVPGPPPLPQSYFRRKADIHLGRGRGHPIPLHQPKYSMARWQEGCPRIRVFPSPFPNPCQGNVGGCGR